MEQTTAGPELQSLLDDVNKRFEDKVGRDPKAVAHLPGDTEVPEDVLGDHEDDLRQILAEVVESTSAEELAHDLKIDTGLELADVAKAGSPQVPHYAYLTKKIYGVRLFIPYDTAKYAVHTLQAGTAGGALSLLVIGTGPIGVISAILNIILALESAWVTFCNERSGKRGVYLTWTWPQIALLATSGGIVAAAGQPIITKA